MAGDFNAKGLTFPRHGHEFHIDITLTIANLSDHIKKWWVNVEKENLNRHRNIYYKMGKSEEYEINRK